MQALRLTKNQTCDLLAIGTDKLNKLVKDDSTFPRPIKDGNTRQASVYFDRISIEEWWYKKLRINTLLPLSNGIKTMDVILNFTEIIVCLN